MTRTTPLAVDLRALGIVYPGGDRALDRVDLQVPGGQVTALVGANGSGKTTLLRVLAGRVRPTSGHVRVLGVETGKRPRRLFGRIGYASQEPALDPEMTGGEILRLFASLYRIPRPRRRSRQDELIETFGLSKHIGRRVSAYSGGLRQRLHLALTLIHEPELLLLDEPSAALDPPGRNLLWQMLAKHAQGGGAAVVVSHDTSEVELHCDRAVVLDGGRIVADTTHAQRLWQDSDSPLPSPQKDNSSQGERD